jgi:hypothetical protein
VVIRKEDKICSFDIFLLYFSYVYIYVIILDKENGILLTLFFIDGHVGIYVETVPDRIVVFSFRVTQKRQSKTQFKNSRLN